MLTMEENWVKTTEKMKPSTWYLFWKAKNGNLKEKGWDELEKRIRSAWKKLDVDFDADLLDWVED